MNPVIKKINLKRLLKSWCVTNSDFSFDIEYQNGLYCTFGDIGYEVAFGKKTKSKHIAFIEVSKPLGNFLLKEMELISRIGEKLNSKGEEELHFYGIKYNTDADGSLSSIYIEDYEVIEKNSNQSKNLKFLNDFVEPLGSTEIHNTLFGEWEYDKEYSYFLNSHKTNKKEVDEQLSECRLIYNFYDDNTAEFFNLDYTSDFGGSFYKVKTINSDGSFQLVFVTEDRHYKSLEKFIIHEGKLVLVAGNRKDKYKSCYRKAWSRTSSSPDERPRRREYNVYMNGK